MCTSPYPIKKGGCLGEIDFGQGIQYEIKGKERQRYCVPCNAKICNEEPVQQEPAKAPEPELSSTEEKTK